jgi:uncharacterized protein
MLPWRKAQAREDGRPNDTRDRAMAMVRDEDSVLRILRDSHRVAVLGIKTEAQRSAPAYYVPAYLQRSGYEVIPVPVYYPDATTILGEPVYRRLADIPGSVDLVVVFRRPQDIPQHVDDIVEKRPRAVWFQLGIRNDAAAARLAEAGIEVVQDRCTMIDHRRII